LGWLRRQRVPDSCIARVTLSGHVAIVSRRVVNIISKGTSPSGTNPDLDGGVIKPSNLQQIAMKAVRK